MTYDIMSLIDSKSHRKFGLHPLSGRYIFGKPQVFIMVKTKQKETTKCTASLKTSPFWEPFSDFIWPHSKRAQNTQTPSHILNSR